MTGQILLIIRLALTVVLYLFIGSILVTLWRDLQQQRTKLSLHQTPQIRLSVQTNGASDVHHFSIPVFTIGRDPTCEFPLSSDTVSARHAQLSFHHGQWWVEDLESTNGTFLNQQSISTPTVLTQGDQLRCGEVFLIVSIIESSSSQTTE